MSYDDYRKAKIAGYYEAQLQTLLSEFNPSRPTVILMPGGMGSQLERTEHPMGTEPNVINDVLWVDPGIVWPKYDALQLRIEIVGGSERDRDSHVVAAHGPLKFIGQTPYEELRDFARDNAWNYCVFGYDWRRPLEESASYFRAFVSGFRKQVLAAHRIDPIPNLTIVCHSMGGLVCTYALRNKPFSALGFHAVMTIATPFYGTSNQQERYYSGDGGVLNTIYGVTDVVDITSTLPGPYTLMFLPKQVYDRDGSKLGLSRYPQYDPKSKADANPYDAGLIKRWPRVVQDHRQFLDRARREAIYVSQPIEPGIAPVFFNVRSRLDTSTAVELEWSDVDGDKFKPGVDASPIAGVADPNVGGDGTVPAWSAFHADCRPGNRHDLKTAQKHGLLLEHDEVLAVIKSVVMTRKLPKTAKRAAKAPAAAGRARTARAIDAWTDAAESKTALPNELFESAVQRAVVGDLMAGPKPRMVRRAKRS